MNIFLHKNTKVSVTLEVRSSKHACREVWATHKRIIFIKFCLLSHLSKFLVFSYTVPTPYFNPKINH